MGYNLLSLFNIANNLDDWVACFREVPEIAFLAAAVFLHGIQRAHTTVLLQSYAVWEKILTGSFCGCRKQGAHHHYSKKEQTRQRKSIVDK